MTSDSKTASTNWVPAPANETESWALAAGVVGWVERAPLDALALLRGEVKSLEARRNAIQTELSDAREAGFAAGVAEGMASLQPWVTAVEFGVKELSATLRERAVDTALVIAEVIVRDEVLASRLTISSVVERALADHTSAPTRILVAPHAIAELQRTLEGNGIHNTIAVAGDPALEDGDAILAFPDGQIDARVATLIQAFRADVVTELAND